jgi:hypothetical protein
MVLGIFPSIIDHQSSIINHQSSIINHQQSSITVPKRRISNQRCQSMLLVLSWSHTGIMLAAIPAQHCLHSFHRGAMGAGASVIGRGGQVWFGAVWNCLTLPGYDDAMEDEEEEEEISVEVYDDDDDDDDDDVDNILFRQHGLLRQRRGALHAGDFDPTDYGFDT